MSEEARAERVTLAQLSAVHSLLSIGRAVEQHDILIATILEILQSGPRKRHDILLEANRVWPGAGIDEMRIQHALDAAQVANLVAPTDLLEGAGWALTELGNDEVAASRDWAAEAVTRTRHELRERALRGGLTLATDEEAALWTGILADALFIGIRRASAAYMGDVEMLADETLAPRSFHTESMFELIRNATAARHEVTEFLTAMAVAAIDPSDPFANELVSHVATGYMLHAFVARRDRMSERKALGELSNERIVLDTPVLFPLLGPSQEAEPIEQLIAASRTAGIEVVVADHTIDELVDVVKRLREHEVGVVEKALKDGVDPGALAPFVSEEILRSWLRGCEEGIYATWGDFENRAFNLGERLSELGIHRRPHHNDTHFDHVDEIEAELAEQLAARNTGRGKTQIERDAHTLAMVWRKRRRERGTGRFWPGAWVVTTDTHMRPTYRTLEPDDTLPIAVTPSQWLGMVSSCCDPPSIEDLAEAAARLLAQETMLSIAAKYPPRVAIDIARALSEVDHPSETDVRVAQISFDEILDEYPDILGDPITAGAQFAAAVVGRRNKRMSAAYSRGSERLITEQSRAVAQAAASDAAAQAERDARAEAEKRALDAEQEAGRQRRMRSTEQILSKRREIRAALFALCAIGVVLFVVVGLWAAAIGAVLSAVILSERSANWVTDIDVSWSRLLLVPLGELIALIDLVRLLS